MDNLQWYRLIVVTALITLTTSSATSDSLMGGHLDNEPTTPIDEDSHHYRPSLVPLAFNGGQPFSLEKDPVTGQIDFNKAPPFKALNYTGSYASDYAHKEESDIANEETENDTIDSPQSHKNEDDQQIPNEINPYSPSFHDYLNLPVRYNNHEKYTSDKYPLISSSYANTKVQGGTSGFKIYNSLNHKNYNSLTHPGKASTSQSYSNTRTPYVPRTTKRPTTIRTTTTTTAKPTTSTTTTTERTTTTRATTVTKKPAIVTEPVTTWKPRPIDRYGLDYDEEVMLPIEKMQNSGNGGDGNHFVSFPKYDYEDGYGDYLHLDPSSSSSSSSSTTTTKRPSSSSSSTTTTSTTTERPTTKSTIRTTESTEFPESSQSSLINNQRPPLINLVNNVVNGHQNYPPISNGDNSQKHPGFNSLVVESSSNVIVPPDQDTISFVLGNRQNVQGTYYGHGSAVAESPYGDAVVSPNRMDTVSFDDLKIGIPSPEVQAPQKGSGIPSGFKLPQREGSNSGQKWWFNHDQSDKTQSIVDDNKDNRVNVGAGYRVVFPTSEPSTLSTNPSSNPSFSSTEVPSSTLGSSGLGLTELSDVLVPPAVDRPIRLPQGHPQSVRPHYHHHHYHSRPSDIPTRIQRPPNSTPNGYKIRPPMDINLPNILPQFRPNVKTSQRRGSEAIGTMIISTPQKFPPRVSVRPSMHSGPSHRPPLHPPPQRRPVSHLQRLKPPPPPPPPPIHALRLPSPEALVDLREQQDDHQKDVLIRRNVGGEGLIDERNRGNQVLKSRLNDENSEKLEGPSLPPRPPVFFKRKNGNDTRVTTLQMIQHHGVDVEGVDEEMLRDEPHEEIQQDADRRVGGPVETPVFVVYPVTGAIGINGDGDSPDVKHDESVVVGTHGGERPLPPDTLSLSQQDDDEEEVRIPAKGVLASDFPYPLERPDPAMFISLVRERPLLVPSEQIRDDEEEDGFLKERERDTSVNVIPYLQDHVPYAIKQNAISTTLHVGTSGLSSGSGGSVDINAGSTPIAFVYTPTMRPHHQSGSSEIYERNPVLLPSQQPSSSSSSAPSPQNFMAPFFASVSAEVPSRDGWSVVTIKPAKEIHEKLEIPARKAEDRIDDGKKEGKGESEERGGNTTTSADGSDGIGGEKTAEEMQTEASDFDAENFKPQLFGGFQPILEFPTDSAEVPSELRNKEAVGVMEKPRGMKESAPRTSYEN